MSPQPAPMSGPTTTEDRPVTTLNQATSEIWPKPQQQRTPVLAIVLSIAIVAVIISIVVVVKRRDRDTTASGSDNAEIVAAKPAPADAGVKVTPIPIDAPPSFESWLGQHNPFVTVHGIATLSHQVTRGEYRYYLDGMTADSRASAQPLYHWEDTGPELAVAWLPQERAAQFCAAIGGKLPTSEQWSKLSNGGWGIDAAGDGKLGPLQEWTSTVADGLATARGGNDRMPPDRQKAAATEPLLKSLTGAPASIASGTIGFRCVR